MSSVIKTIKKHFPGSKGIDRNGIIIDEKVREMCKQNVCGHYGRNWTCPPAVSSLGDIRRKLAEFNNAVIIYKIYDIKSNFDLKGMVDGISDFRSRLIMMKNDFPDDTEFMILGAGSCLLCEKCAYIDGEKCKNPEDAFISVEASGIDVMRLMKDNGLNYHNGPKTVTYIGMVLHNS